MNIKDNPVPLPDLTISEYETIMYALENMDKYPGLSGNAYRKLITKLEKLQNGVETANELLIKKNVLVLNLIMDLNL